jgi:hypothetical protein
VLNLQEPYLYAYLAHKPFKHEWGRSVWGTSQEQGAFASLKGCCRRPGCMCAVDSANYILAVHLDTMTWLRHRISSLQHDQGNYSSTVTHASAHAFLLHSSSSTYVVVDSIQIRHFILPH